MVKSLPAIAIAAGALGLFAMPASSAPVTFVYSGTGTGSLDGSVFGASDFTITATADTDDRQTYGSGYFIDHITASIAIDGLGTFEFVTATTTFVNNDSDVIGFNRISGDLYNLPVGFDIEWDMLSSLGPIAGTASLLQWLITPVVTSGGVLVFDSARSDATFEAIVAGTEVPEPAALALFGLGILGVGLARRRK